VVLGWPKQPQPSAVETQQQKCFVVRPAKIGCVTQPDQLFLAQLVSWSAVLLSSDEWSKPLNVVTELPSICDAPVLRLLFQLSGFVDYRSQSIAKLLARGHYLLCFDETLAALQAQKCDECASVEIVMR